MPIVSEVEGAIDTDFAGVRTGIDTQQTSYKGTNGRYCECLPTHSVPPVDGASTAADQLALVPSYEASAWSAMGITVFTKPYSLEIQQYNSPAGLGYTYTLRATINGQLYLRSQDSGAIASRTIAWTLIWVSAWKFNLNQNSANIAMM